MKHAPRLALSWGKSGHTGQHRAVSGPAVSPEQLAEEWRIAERETPATHQIMQSLYGQIPLQARRRGRR